MIAAKSSKRFYDSTRLAVLREGANRVEHFLVGDLTQLFTEGDLLVVNSAATLPSSFETSDVEIRLASFQGTSLKDFAHWRAVLFGKGSWREPTEKRNLPRLIKVGERLRIGEDLVAVVKNVDSRHSRLIDIEFQSPHLVQALYRNGKLIQYSYLEQTLQVWDQQTLFSSAPISVEPPSASFPLTWELMFALQKKGVRLASVIHGAGLSSTGDADFDKRLPLDEYFEVPEETLVAVRNAKRVIAVGTSACRAIESAFRLGVSKGRTTLRIDSLTDLQVTDALLTGMHDPQTSHFDLMSAFGDTSVLERETRDYRSHEYGDLTLLFRES